MPAFIGAYTHQIALFLEFANLVIHTITGKSTLFSQLLR